MVRLRALRSGDIVRDEVVVVRVGMRPQTDEMKRTLQGHFHTVRLQGYAVRQTDVSLAEWGGRLSRPFRLDASPGLALMSGTEAVRRTHTKPRQCRSDAA